MDDQILYSELLQEYYTGVFSSVCKSISALEEHCTKVVSYVNDVLCPGVGAILVHRFGRFLKSMLTGKVKLIITYFFMLLFVQKYLTIFVQSWHLSKTEVMCWLSCFRVNHTTEG